MGKMGSLGKKKDVYFLKHEGHEDHEGEDILDILSRRLRK